MATATENVAIVAEANAGVEPDGTERIVELSDEIYNAVVKIATKARERGLPDGFDYWLERLVKTGAQTVVRPWNDRDIVTLFNKAQDPKASLAARKEAAAKLSKMMKLES